MNINSEKNNEISIKAPDGSLISENFENWFSESVVLNSDKQPLVVFHGTSHDFYEFNMSTSFDGAHFFTDDKSHAQEFGATKSFFLRMVTPMIIDDENLYVAWDHDHPDGQQDYRNLLPRHYVKQFVVEAKLKRHDGLIIRQMGDLDSEVDMYLPFSPEQIKSATLNNGLFDIKCADFTDKTSALNNNLIDLNVTRKRKKNSFKP
jgi:hypothetical protein